MKILHLPTAAAGQAWGLSQAERKMGLDSTVLIAGANPYNFSGDINLSTDLFKSNKYLHRFFLDLKKLICFFSIRKKYDVFHFNFGQSLLSYPIAGMYLLDLPYYSTNAKIIVTYNGCDARQKYATLKRTQYAACANSKCYNGVCNNIKVENTRAAKIKIFDQYASSILAVNPDIMYFLPERAKFVPYANAVWDEIDTLEYKLSPARKLRVVHAPTNRECKGSDHVINAFNILNKKYGKYVDFILVENLKRNDALKIFQQADLVIDQLLIGWYGGFSVEVMKMGKPVMVYLSEADMKFLPPEMRRDCLETFINVNAYNIIDKLAEIFENPSLLEDYSRRSINYVEKWHKPEVVAKQVIEEYIK